MDNYIDTAREHLHRCKGCKLAKDVNRFRISESCGPARGDEGMGSQDKVVLSGGAGVFSAGRVAKGYKSDGGAMLK